MASLAAAAGGKENTRPWVDKHRPACLDDVIAHEEILSTLRRLMASNNLPHLLFYGPPGTGKTTTIGACARHLFGPKLKGSVLEMNASDDRGIDIIRNEIKDFASTTQVLFGPRAEGSAGIKLIILDEADQMSNEAQAALRRVIEKYTKNVRFCIICNHVNKIIPAVQSRCTRFRFGPVKKASMAPRLSAILTQENVEHTADGVAAAIKLCNGDMRRCLNILQAASLSLGQVTEETIYRSTGNPTPKDVREILEVCLSTSFTEAYDSVATRAHFAGLAVTDLLRELHTLLQRIDLPPDCKCFLYVTMADIESNLAAGTSEEVGLSALVGGLQLVREAVTHNMSIRALAPEAFRA